MEMYPQAAYCLLHGKVLQSCDVGFTYPPLFAFLMLSLEPLPLWLRDLVWYLITAGVGFRDQRAVNLGRVVLAISFVLVTVTGNDVVGETVTVWAYGHSSMVLGTLVLLVYFAALAVERSRRGDFAATPGKDRAPLDAGVVRPAE
jgi:hypothetical protein